MSTDNQQGSNGGQPELHTKPTRESTMARRIDSTWSAGPGPVEAAAADASKLGAFKNFMQNEKWLGKKGLAFAAATVMLGATYYAVSKWLDKGPNETQNWVDRTASAGDAQRGR